MLGSVKMINEEEKVVYSRFVLDSSMPTAF